MTTDFDTARIVRSWLREGATELPDRVLDAVLDELPATPQRRATWWPARRLSAMNTTLKFGLAAVVVAVAAVIGLNSLAGTGVGGPAPVESTPSPEPTATAEPTATSEPSSTPEGLPEGTFVLTDGEVDGMRNVPTTVTIPAPGWYGSPGNGILGNIPEEEDFGAGDAGLIGPFVGDIFVPADPCQWSTTMPDTPATTVDEVVAALRGQASRDASEPVDITVDGHAGKSIILHVPDDAVFTECHRDPFDPEGKFCTLTQDDPTVCHRYQQFPGQIDELWIVDVNGDVVVIDSMWSDATPAEAVAELRAILDSIQFETP